MDEARKRELEQLLAQKAQKDTQAKHEEDRAKAKQEGFRTQFAGVATTVIEPVLREFEQTVKGNGFTTEVGFEKRSNGYDRVYLYILPSGHTPERYPENRRMAIFRAEVHAERVAYFDNTIKNLGGESFPDGDYALSQITREKVEELVFAYVKRIMAKAG
ncbi:MAG: hypothetical protein U0804_21620 [Gemmataceae bacterium]